MDLFQKPNPTRPPLAPSAASAANFAFDSESHPRGKDGKFTTGGGSGGSGGGSGGGGGKSSDSELPPSMLDAPARAKKLAKEIQDDPNPPKDDRRHETLKSLKKSAKSTGKPPRWWAALRTMLGAGYRKGYES